MKTFAALAPLALTVAGGVVYHISAKSLPKDINPGLVLVVAYATALAVSGAVYLAMPSASPDAAPSRVLHPAVIAVGIGAAMIEFGYVFTYRASWPISIASVLINSMVSVLLVFAGVSIFSEHVSAPRLIGVGLCLAGAWLLRG